LVRNPAPLATHLFGDKTGEAAAQLEASWLESLAARAKPLEAARWPRDTHGTVADYWLETQRLAAGEMLPAAVFARFDAAFARHAAATVTPNVVILLIAAAEVLEERIAFRARRPPPQTDLFADVAPSPATTC